MEPIARRKYEEITGYQVLDSGLVIKMNQPFLCGTPDGFIETADGLMTLEIKCPSSLKTKSMIELGYLKEGKLVKSHSYYTQVQIQMFVSNCTACHLFVYSPEECNLIKVERDLDFL